MVTGDPERRENKQGSPYCPILACHLEAVFSLQWVEGKLKQSLVVYWSGGNKYRGFERLRWPESFLGRRGKKGKTGGEGEGEREKD